MKRRKRPSCLFFLLFFFVFIFTFCLFKICPTRGRVRLSVTYELRIPRIAFPGPENSGANRLHVSNDYKLSIFFLVFTRLIPFLFFSLLVKGWMAGETASRRSQKMTTPTQQYKTPHYGTKPGNFGTSKIHFPTSEGVSEVSERANE